MKEGKSRRAKRNKLRRRASDGPAQGWIGVEILFWEMTTLVSSETDELRQ